MGKLVVMLALVVVGASACFGDSVSTNAPNGTRPIITPTLAKTTLRIQIRTATGTDKVVKTTTLGCSPPAGTTPDPQRACAALRDYVGHYRPPSAVCSPPLPAIGSLYAIITGTVDGHRVNATLQPGEMCYVATRLVNDLYRATALRAASALPAVLSISVETAPGSLDTTKGQVSPAFPVRNAELALTRAGAAKSVVVSTDSAGHFRVTLPAGEYVLRYVRPGDHATWHLVAVAGTTTTQTLQEHVL
jgi:Subtilisin inhibitor-like